MKHTDTQRLDALERLIRQHGDMVGMHDDFGRIWLELGIPMSTPSNLDGSLVDAVVEGEDIREALDYVIRYMVKRDGLE